MNTKYYFENSIAICCTKVSEIILEKQLNGKICSECNSKLAVVTMQEGTYLLCYKNPWKHSVGYTVNCDEYEYEKPPKIVKKQSMSKAL